MLHAPRPTVPPPALAPSAHTPDRVRGWTFWIALVVVGFLWQFVGVIVERLRS